MLNNVIPSILGHARSSGTDATADPLPLELGQRVRDLHKSLGWTLEQAAKQAGLARSTLSKIENSQMSPIYDVLKKLAAGLEVSVSPLFMPPERDQAMGRIGVTNSGEGQGYATVTYKHEMLAFAPTIKARLPYRARIRARLMEEFYGWVSHDCEEFLFVLTGTLWLYTEFYEPTEMRRGDSAYRDAAMGHNVVSTSQEDAMMLWVTTIGNAG